MWLAGNAGPKKIAKNTPSRHHRTTFSCYIFSTKACIDNRTKILLNSNTSSTYPDNMVNFGPLTAEICWRVWGTRANFNRFHILAALLHGTLVVGVTRTAALNRGCHLYSAERPSRWALAHILVVFGFAPSAATWFAHLWLLDEGLWVLEALQFWWLLLKSSYIFGSIASDGAARCY